MIALLANGLVEDNILKTTAKDALYGKKILTTNADALIEIIGLAQHIKNKAEEFGGFPQTYLTLLKNIISGLTAIRKDKIDTIDKIQGTLMKPTPVGYSSFPIEILNDRMVSHLEQDILYLIKITNRQKMNQVMDLESQLSELTESLKEEFENLKNKNSPLNSNQLKSKLNQIQKTLQKLLDKLSQQNQSLPDEFLNSKSYKSMNLDEMMSSIKKVQELANKGKMDEAVKQLEKMAEDLRNFAEQLNQADSSMDEMVDTELMEKVDQSMNELENMEKKQRKIINETSKINQELRKKQSRKFESMIQNIFEELKNGRLAMGDPDYVPAGEYAREALLNLGLWENVAKKIVNKVLEYGLPNETLLNVNIPKDTEGGIKGYQITHQGAIYFKDNFEKREDPRGRIYYWMTGDVKDTDTKLESDGVAIKEGYVSITPLQLQMTNFDFINELNEWSF